MQETDADLFRGCKHGLLTLARKFNVDKEKLSLREGDERKVKIKKTRTDASVANLTLHGNSRRTKIRQCLQNTWTQSFLGHLLLMVSALVTLPVSTQKFPTLGDSCLD